MEEIGEVSLLPRRRLTWKESLRRWYARHFYDILDTIFLINIGLIFLTLLCALEGLIK